MISARLCLSFPTLSLLLALGLVAALAHLTFRILDDHGIRIPDAIQPITLEIIGPAELLGFGNADPTNTDDARDATHPAFRGRALALLRSTDATGTITIKATAPSLEPATLQLPSQR